MRWCRQLGALSAAGGCKTRDVARAVQHTGVRAPRRAWWHSPVRARGQALVEYCAFRCTRAPPREAARRAAGMRAPAPGGSAVAFSRGGGTHGDASPPTPRPSISQPLARRRANGQADVRVATTPARSPRHWQVVPAPSLPATTAPPTPPTAWCAHARRIEKKYKLSHTRAARASTHLCARALLAERERDGAEALDGAQASGRVLMAQLIDQDRDGVQRVVAVGHAGSAARPRALPPRSLPPSPRAPRSATRTRGPSRAPSARPRGEKGGRDRLATSPTGARARYCGAQRGEGGGGRPHAPSPPPLRARA